MSWTCDTRTLGDAVRQAARCGTDGGGMYIAGHPAGIEIRAAGAQNSLRLHRVVTGSSDDQHSIIVTPRLLGDIVDSLDTDTVTLTLDGGGGRLAVRGGRAQFELVGRAGDDYPKFTGPARDGVVVAGGQFAAAAARVLPAVSTDTNRAILTGVLLEDLDDGLRMLATDSYRVAWADLPGTSLGETGNTAVIPGTLLEEVARGLKDAPVTVVVEDDAVHFGTDGTWLSAALITGTYPPYRRLLDIADTTIVAVDAAELAATLGTVGALLRHAANEPVRLHITAGGITATGTSREIGTSHSDCDATVTGPDVEVGFNLAYLTSALKTVGGPVQIRIESPIRPVLITPADGVTSYGCLVMPVRLPA